MLSYGAVPHYSPCWFPSANSPCQFPPFLESLLLGILPLVWCDPVLPGPRLLVDWPPPPHSLPIQISRPPGVPQINCAPTKTTSRSRLYIIWNTSGSPMDVLPLPLLQADCLSYSATSLMVTPFPSGYTHSFLSLSATKTVHYNCSRHGFLHQRMNANGSDTKWFIFLEQ